MRLHTAALALVPTAADVHADETSMRQQGLRKKTCLWDFITPDLMAYRYALSRSGDMPKQVLGDSTGRLVVDQHTGYLSAAEYRGLPVGCGCRRKQKNARSGNARIAPRQGRAMLIEGSGWAH